MKRGASWIQQDPARWLRLIPRKWSHTFDHESYPIGYLAEADKAGWPQARQRRSRGLLSWVHGLLLCLAPLAFVPRRASARGLVGLAAVTSLAVHAWSSPVHTLWPLAIMIVALALLAMADLRASRGVLHYAAFAIGTVCLVHAVFFGEDRYHMAVSPLLCLLAAAAWRTPRVTPAAR
jgi:hypothetical protein